MANACSKVSAEWPTRISIIRVNRFIEDIRLLVSSDFGKCARKAI